MAGDWIDALLAGDADAGAKVAAHIAAFASTERRDAEPAVRLAEAKVSNDPGLFTFDAGGHATLDLGLGPMGAGRFETPTLADLEARCPTFGGGRRVRLLVLDGASPATDVGALQSTAAPGTLFQVASQFNCLESPGPYLADVAGYFGDPTQGPRASISAYPATLLRRYAAPAADGSRFAQRDDRQVELLADAIGVGAAPAGYFTGARIGDLDAAVAALESRFDQIRVGVHDRAQVMFGYDWHGRVDGVRHVAQVFTSTVAGGGYGGERHLGPDRFARAARQLLRAAYLGTLLAAASLRSRRVVLTLIGGGVFANPIAAILDAIEWSLAQAAPRWAADIDILLNGHNLGTRVDLARDVLPLARAHGGAIARIDRRGLVEVLR